MKISRDSDRFIGSVEFADILVAQQLVVRFATASSPVTSRAA